MSSDTVKDFFAKAASDTEIHEQVKKALEERGEMAPFEIVDIAAALGFTFTATELREHFASTPEGELDDADLEAVSGGLVTSLRARFLRARSIRARGRRGIRTNIRKGLRSNIRKTP